MEEILLALGLKSILSMILPIVVIIALIMIVSRLGDIRNDLEKLNRADVITSRAKNELNMVVASPETLVVTVKRYALSEL